MAILQPGPPGKRKNLPNQLKWFCGYLIVMLFVSVGLQLVYVVLVDDWTLGLANSAVARISGYAGIGIVLTQHLYRMFTIAALLRGARFAVANARIYLAVSFAVIALFVGSSMVYFPTNKGTKAAEVVIQNVGQACILLGLALALILPWWIILWKSRKVRAFEANVVD